MRAIKIQDLKFSNIKFCEKRPHGVAKKIVITYNKQPLNIQLPKFSTPFGLNNKIGWALNLNVNDKAIIEKFENLETYLMDNALLNSKVWFNSEKSYEEFKSNFNKIIQNLKI